MLVVADSGALVALDVAEHLDVLPLLYRDVRIPRHVARELLAAGPRAPGALVPSLPWVTVQDVDPADPVVQALRATIDTGEAEAIALASHLTADMVLVDDRSARSAARRLGLHVKGTLGVLLQAKRAGHIPAVRPAIDRMRAAGIYLSDLLVQRVMTDAKETS